MPIGSNVMGGFVQGLSAMGSYLNQREELEMRKELFEERKADKAKQLQIGKLRGMQALMESDPEGWMNYLDPEQQELADEFLNAPQMSWARDPQSLQNVEMGIQQIHQAMESGDGIDGRLLVDGVNNAFGDQINRGLARDGQPAMEKKISRLFPAPDGNGFFAQLMVRSQSDPNNPYAAPMTEGRGPEAGADVKRIDIGTAMKGMRERQAWVNYIKSKRIALGDEEAWKQHQGEVRGKAVVDAMGGITKGMSLGEQRRHIGGAMLRQGMSAGEMAGAAAVLTPEEKPLTMSGHGGFVSTDQGQSWKQVGDPYFVKDGSGSSDDDSDGLSDKDASKLSKEMIAATFKANQKEMGEIAKKLRAGYTSEMQTVKGKDPITQEDTFTQREKQTKISPEDLTALETRYRQLQEENDYIIRNRQAPRLATDGRMYQSSVESASSKTGIPADELNRMFFAESEFQSNKISPKGAMGIGQLMPATATAMGVTNRADPNQSIDAGARLLKRHYDEFDDPILAHMAYNWGEGRVRQFVAGKIPASSVPRETQDHIDKIWGPGTWSKYASSMTQVPSGKAKKQGTPTALPAPDVTVKIRGQQQPGQAPRSASEAKALGWRRAVNKRTGQVAWFSPDGSQQIMESVTDAEPMPRGNQDAWGGMLR